VTVRNRDTLEQVRMTDDEVVRFLDEQVNGN
jgi:glycyl-tRNA synthetase (class II)